MMVVNLVDGYEQCVSLDPNSTADTLLLSIRMVAGSNNSVWLIELFFEFIEIIHVKQSEQP